MKKMLTTAKFYAIKFPLILLAIFVGFLFEFIVNFPFFVFCTLDGTGSTKKRESRQACGD
jgi:hypothetical protein